MTKQLLFSLTRKDFEWSYFNGTGPGGQGKNKSRSAVRVRHAASGAHAQAQESRSKTDNERLAFQRLTADPLFTKWVRIEAARRTGMLDEIEEKVEREMKSNRIKVEAKRDGKWVDWEDRDPDGLGE